MYKGLNKFISASLIGRGDINKNAQVNNKVSSKSTCKFGDWLLGVQN